MSVIDARAPKPCWGLTRKLLLEKITPRTVVRGGAAGRAMRRCACYIAKSSLTLKGELGLRGAFYVDGFNLYHAINDLSQPHLKWVNLWRLAELVARGHAKTIEKVVFCTAYFPGDHGKRVRHERYVAAQTLAGVESRFGHTTKEPMSCGTCRHRWDAPREKETDINVALAVFDDAYQNVFDVAFMVTADTDQAATLRAMRSRFPDKRMITVAPPGRDPAKHLRALSYATIRLTAAHLDQCVFPPVVMRDGMRTVQRPAEYAPPKDWVHPDSRPR